MKINNLIIGGGLSGITIATHLWKRSAEFLLLESAPRLGGKIETKMTPEASYEFGPNSFTNQTEEILELLELLGLGPEILEPSRSSKKRFILKRGKITQLPSKPPEILTTKALTFGGRLRFLREFFYTPPRPSGEESAWDFFERHFGREVADYFVDPFVSGIFAGDAKKISLAQAFPTMAEAEGKSESLLRYLISQRKTARTTPQSYQLKNGLESIFHRFLKQVGDEKIRLSEKVQEISPDGNKFRVVTDKAEYETSRLYLTTPAYVSAPLLKKNFAGLAAPLSAIDYAPVITIHLKVPQSENYPFDGFGILIPSSEERKILGVLWNSGSFPSLFPDKRHHYLTVYAGGARQRELVQEDENRVKAIILNEVQQIFDLRAEPILIHLRRHHQAIPQYNLGYGKILKALEENLKNCPNLKLAGNYIGGISMPKTVTSAKRTVVSDDF
ncbi:MAG: protoporphyrinogen oxidase [Deltaproteobacteria bacterium]|nr:protoporphyrinogen oxidase [Deltaproteobacteria bacterium]